MLWHTHSWLSCQTTIELQNKKLQKLTTELFERDSHRAEVRSEIHAAVKSQLISQLQARFDAVEAEAMESARKRAATELSAELRRLTEEQAVRWWWTVECAVSQSVCLSASLFACLCFLCLFVCSPHCQPFLKACSDFGYVKGGPLTIPCLYDCHGRRSRPWMRYPTPLRRV